MTNTSMEFKNCVETTGFTHLPVVNFRTIINYASGINKEQFQPISPSKRSYLKCKKKPLFFNNVHGNYRIRARRIQTDEWSLNCHFRYPEYMKQ